MKTTLILLSVFAAAALFAFCKNVRFTASNLPSKQLRFGNGGGITGKEVTFTLLENGQIFKRDGVNAALTELKPANQKISAALFKNSAALGLSKMDFTHPGNIFSFIEIQDGSASKRISWGDSKFPVDPKIQDLYSQLTKLVSEKK